MKKFRVLLSGENFLMNQEGAVKRFGFYTTRFVEALDKGEAERFAIESLRQHDQLREGVLNDHSDPPMLFAEEIDEVSTFEDVENQVPGLAFYEDEPTGQ